MIIGKNNIYLAKRLKFCFILVTFQELFLVWINSGYSFVKTGNSFIITFSVLLSWLLFIKEKPYRQILNSTTEKIFIFIRRRGIGSPISLVKSTGELNPTKMQAWDSKSGKNRLQSINQSINNFINVSG